MEVNPNQLSEKISGAKKGSQSAFNYLVDSFWGDVYGFQLKKTQNEYEAEDITIQTFSKAFNRIETFDVNYSFATNITKGELYAYFKDIVDKDA